MESTDHDKGKDHAPSSGNDSSDGGAEAPRAEQADAEVEAGDPRADQADTGAEAPQVEQADTEAKAGERKGKRRLRDVVIIGTAVLAAGFAAGFAGGFITGPGIGVGSGDPRTLEELASVTGCRPVVMSNEDFRQGNCKTKRGQFVLLTFKTDEGKEAWVEQARDYGGMFLVGTRWAIVGSGPDRVTYPMLEEFRGELGGQIRPGRKHTGTGGISH